MEHKRIKEKIPLLVIGKLKPYEKWEVEKHLETCDGCRKRYEFEKYLYESLNVAGNEALKGFIFRALGRVLFVIAMVLMFVSFPNKVEVAGIDDVWEGYVLINGSGYIKAKIFVDNIKWGEKGGFGSVYFNLSSLPEDIYHIRIIVNSDGKIYEFSNIVNKVLITFESKQLSSPYRFHKPLSGLP